MVKKHEEGRTLTIEHAAAAHLELNTERPTAKNCPHQLLATVKAITGNPTLTVRNVKQSLRPWLEEGWVTFGKDSVQVTRSGRAPIRRLADEATTLMA